MKSNLYLVAILVLVFSFSLQAQEIWSLEKCIDYARENSITMKQADVGIENAKLTEKQSRMERMPTLNASASGAYAFGRTIDPTTNTFQRLSRGTNGLSVTAGYTVFNGGRIKNTIEQSKLDLEAQKAETADIANDIALSVAVAYINILFSQEQLANAEKRLNQTQQQLEQTDRLILAGSLPENERLQILAQIAQDEQQVITQENNVQINYLSLKNLLQLDPDFDLQIVSPDEVPIPTDIDPNSFDFRTVYNVALQKQPVIKAGALRVQSAGLGVDIAKSGKLPSVSLFGNIRSDYATGIPDPGNIINPGNDQFVPIGLASFNGEESILNLFQLGVGAEFGERSYIDQINDNFGQSVGIQVNIPIYNQHRNNINMQRAELNIISAELQLEQNKQQLKADVQRSIADARAAKKQLEAAQKSVNALNAAYVNTQKRFQLGAATTFEFTSAKTQLDLSTAELTIAKYDYLYKLKIVDFYMGKKITL